jgi:hypothetical protein
MMKPIAILIAITASMLTVTATITAQEVESHDITETEQNSGMEFSMYADLVSQYVWRGRQLHPEANIQPGLNLVYKNLSLGVWTSSALASPFTEADFVISYSFPAFTVSLTDYYAVNQSYFRTKEFFNYSNKVHNPTNHAIEISIVTNGLAGIPLNITAATFFYGNDKDDSGKNFYSSYLEAAYFQQLKNYVLSYFLGGTLNEGFYAAKASVTNLGVRLKKEVKINPAQDFSFSSGLVFNPDRGEIYFIFGLGI